MKLHVAPAMQDLADGRVQALAWAKYVAMLAFTTLQRRLTYRAAQAGGGKQKGASAKQQQLLEK